MTKHNGNGNGNRSVPNLENATVGFLVDEIGRLREEEKRNKFLQGIYKQALEARASQEQLDGTQFMEGEKYIGDRAHMTQRRLKAEKVVEEFKDQPERLARCYDEISFWQLNTKVLIKEV